MAVVQHVGWLNNIGTMVLDLLVQHPGFATIFGLQTLQGRKRPKPAPKKVLFFLIYVVYPAGRPGPTKFSTLAMIRIKIAILLFNAVVRT